MANSKRLPIWIALGGALLGMLACAITPQAPAFPTPLTATPGQPARSRTILPAPAPDGGLAAPPSSPTAAPPTLPPSPTAASPTLPPPATASGRGRPTAPASSPTAAPPTALPRPAATVPAPTLDPHLVIIREADIRQALAGGVGEEQGLKAQGLQVSLRAGKLTVTADELGLGPLQIKQLAMVGRLTAQAGQLRFEPETISPRGLVASLLPALANQALAQFAGAWYIEEVQIADGQLILRIR